MKVRESNIELLRIIAACCVVFSHMSPIISKALLPESGGIFQSTGTTAWNQIIQQLFLSFSVCAVNVFVLITGFFSCRTQTRNIGKPLNLILLMIVVDLVSYVLQIIVGTQRLTIDGLMLHAFPTNYFVTLFIVLYIISPYINLCLNKLSEKGIIRMVLILFIVFSIYPSLIDIIEESIGKHITGISPIGRLGSQNGYNIINFMLVYCIGALINVEKVKSLVEQYKHLPHVAIIVCVLSIFVWNRFSHSAVNYHNPFVIILAMSVVLAFMQIHFTSRSINGLAKAAFTAFLLHVHFIHYIHIDYFCHQSPLLFVIFIIVSITVIYLVSWVAWMFYNLVTKLLFERLNKIQIPYSLD